MREFSCERVLMDQCACGDREAYSDLYKTYISSLFRYIFFFTRSEYLSEEIVQETFVKIWQNRDTLHGVQLFEPYLFKTAKNLLLDNIRREKLEQRYHAQLLTMPEGCQIFADNDLIYRQYYELAQQAINLLPMKRRQIFEMKTKQDCTLDEIAEKLGISKSVVKKQLYSASNFVKDYLRKHGEMTVNVVIIAYFSGVI